MVTNVFTEPTPPVKLATPYSWKTTAWKAVKVGVVAIVGWLLADPAILTQLNEAVPTQYRMLAAILTPMAISALRNWYKQQAGN